VNFSTFGGDIFSGLQLEGGQSNTLVQFFFGVSSSIYFNNINNNNNNSLIEIKFDKRNSLQ